MRSFSELTAIDMMWQGDIGFTIPDLGNFHFVLYAGQDPVATAHMTWERQRFFDVMLESGDGTFESHMDLTRTNRPTTVWKTGESEALVSFAVAWELIVSCGGTIDTRDGRKLLFEPTQQMSAVYAIFPEGGARILTLAGPAATIAALSTVPGHMSIEPGSASDPDLPALVTLALTVASEEPRLLHQPTMR
jgi:hypothetical protein